jgi:phospho-N-acetylmuramoyl-pentapeptide-transferase
MIILEVIKILAPSTAAFIIGIAITPAISHFLYANRMWKKKAGKVSLDGTVAEMFNTLHKEKEVGTPRFGGLVVWGSVLITSGLFFLLARVTSFSLFDTLSFVSRGQTWIPLATLILGAFVGFIDDLFEVKGIGKGAGGLSLGKRLVAVFLTSGACAWWFYSKLEVSTVMLPFHGPIELGLLFIPFFIAVALCIYASGVIDGLDGLAGGIFASIFTAYAGIAFFESQVDLAALCGTIAGALLAFLWFNIPPARFYLSETGTMGLTLALTVVAFLTDSLGGGFGVAILPVAGFLLVVTVASVLLQIFWKKVFKRKLFRVAPLHHHFEALGWPSYKVTMRYWVVGIVTAILGVCLALVG